MDRPRNTSVCVPWSNCWRDLSASAPSPPGVHRQSTKIALAPISRPIFGKSFVTSKQLLAARMSRIICRVCSGGVKNARGVLGTHAQFSPPPFEASVHFSNKSFMCAPHMTSEGSATFPQNLLTLIFFLPTLWLVPNKAKMPMALAL